MAFKNLLSFVFLTFVLTSPVSHALNKNPNDRDVQNPGVDSGATGDVEKLNDLNLSAPPKPVKTTKDAYRYTQAISTRLAYLLDTGDDNDTDAVMGIKYLPESHDLTRWEFGVDVRFDYLGLIHASRRRTLNPTDYLRPFFSYGASMQLGENGAFTDFLELETYLVHGVVGLEDLVSERGSIRVEGEALIGTKNKIFLISAGYSWGF